MSLKFGGDEQQQRGNAMKTNTGRQIGQALKSQAEQQQRGNAMKTSTGRAIQSALKSQAIDTAKNIATDVLLGNNLKEGLNREVNNIRARAADGIQKLNTARNAYVAEDDSELESTKQNRKQKVKSVEEDPHEIEPTMQKRKQKQKVKRIQMGKEWFV